MTDISLKDKFEAAKQGGFRIGFNEGFKEGYKRAINAVKTFIDETVGDLT